MWSIALLVNTSTWNEFQNNWKLVCIVFLQLHLGEQDINRQYQDILLDKISKIKSDPNIADAIKSSDCVEDANSSDLCDLDTYTFTEDEDDGHFESQKRLSSFKRKVRKVIY